MGFDAGHLFAQHFQAFACGQLLLAVFCLLDLRQLPRAGCPAIWRLLVNDSACQPMNSNPVAAARPSSSGLNAAWRPRRDWYRVRSRSGKITWRKVSVMK
ncbi:hypothetical protein PPS11_40795 [Pseudomonas putida S11]|nr:hypothetical protein PPS11_40795 [Pseudomonas putida S11]